MAAHHGPMLKQTYAELSCALNLPVGACPHQQALLAKYASDGLVREALISLYAQECQSRVIKSNHLIKQRIHAYTDRYLAGADILQLSIEADFPPCMLMRRILEHLIPGSRQAIGDILRQPDKLDSLVPTIGVSGGSTMSFLPHTPQSGTITLAPPGHGDRNGQPAHEHSVGEPGSPRSHGNRSQRTPVKKHGRPHSAVPDRVSTPSSISAHEQPLAPLGSPERSPLPPNSHGGPRRASDLTRHWGQHVSRIKADICRCVLCDMSYSPLCDLARQAVGCEYELLLCDKLRAAGVTGFWTEAQLRAQGAYKTPDVRLQVPIAVLDTCGGAGATSASRPPPSRPRQEGGSGTDAGCTAPGGGTWRVVTWIDSKAAFGDTRLHSKQLTDQYLTYVNRYGPGLVIYWFGFVEGLEQRPDVLIMDHFPEPHELRVLPQLTAQPSQPPPPPALRPHTGAAAGTSDGAV